VFGLCDRVLVRDGGKALGQLPQEGADVCRLGRDTGGPAVIPDKDQRQQWEHSSGGGGSKHKPSPSTADAQAEARRVGEASATRHPVSYRVQEKDGGRGGPSSLWVRMSVPASYCPVFTANMLITRKPLLFDALHDWKLVTE